MWGFQPSRFHHCGKAENVKQEANTLAIFHPFSTQKGEYYTQKKIVEKETAKPFLFLSRFAVFFWLQKGSLPQISIILNHSRLTRPPRVFMLLCCLILLSSQSERYRQSLNMFSSGLVLHRSVVLSRSLFFTSSFVWGCSCVFMFFHVRYSK